MKTLGQSIREHRKKKGMSLRDLAAEIEVSAQFILDVERGRRNLSEEMIEKFEAFFSDKTLHHKAFNLAAAAIPDIDPAKLPYVWMIIEANGKKFNKLKEAMKEVTKSSRQ